MDHEVLDFPRMISKIQEMNMEQEKHEKDLEINTMENPQKELETVLLQMQETLNDNKDINYQRYSKRKSP
jgi:hypothetical protein